MKHKVQVKNTKAIFILIISILFNIGQSKAQVTIGSGNPPNDGALLQLKEWNSETDLTNSTKGFSFPRVALVKKNELYPMYKVGYPGVTNLQNLKYSNIGLTVYNVTNNPVATTETDAFVRGLYQWNGAQWLLIEGVKMVEPAIDELMFGSASLNPSAYTKDVPYKGILSVPYTGGNGGTYNTLPNLTVQGLTFSLQSGRLALGNGQIQYVVEGIPSISSPEVVRVPVSFLGKSDTVTVGNVQEIKTISFAKTKGENFTTKNVGALTYTRLGNLEVRVSESQVGLMSYAFYMEYRVMKPTHVTVLYTKSGSSVGYMVTGRKAADSTTNWYKVKTGATYGDDKLVFDSSASGGPAGSKDDFNPNNRDIVEAIFMLHNTNEVYRVTINSNGALPASGPISAIPPTITVFLEKLD